MSDSHIALAAVAGAHGVKGEVRLKLFAESAESLAKHATVWAGERTLSLKSVKPGKTVVARFAEITDRTAAEALRGTLLTVPRSALPPLADGEYYHADLVGLPCVGRNGEALGTVIAVENFGAGDILEIERPDGKRTMVPFRESVADLAEGRIIADPMFLA